MKLHYLQIRRERVSRLLSLAMSDRLPVKAMQARYLLEQINKRILAESSISGMYSNL